MQNETPKGRILIVDDTAEYIDILSSVLSDYTCLAAVNGERALQLARATPQPELILLDVMMPGMDGFEVCHRLKADEHTSDIPVIFVTAMDDDTDESTSFEVGAVDYITKPLRTPVVQARVATHLMLRRARQDLRDQNAELERRVVERTHRLTNTLEELQQIHEQLKEASFETVLRLSRAAEYKDDDTGAHVQRMSHYSATVARELGLGDEEADAILRAAPMHDIGKIGIPDHVLLKPGKLNAEEWTLMQRHSMMGAEILSGSDAPIIVLAATVARSHHEKWNGAGYPDKLAGEAIPQAGRIVAIADVFDALTSRRPYKEPFSVDKALSIIKEGRGQHFDPDVVDAFFSIFDTILEIKERFSSASATIPLVELTSGAVTKTPS